MDSSLKLFLLVSSNSRCEAIKPAQKAEARTKKNLLLMIGGLTNETADHVTFEAPHPRR